MSARVIHRAWTSAACVALVSFVVSVAGADEVQSTCLDAAVTGQRQMKAGKLTAARAALATCARPVCPGLVQRDCTRWLSEVDDSLPTVVLALRDARERDVPGARVFIDGQAMADALDGRAITLDPGKHVARFEHPAGPPIEETFTLREREKGRNVTAHVAPPARVDDESAPAPRSRGTPAGAYVLAGLAAVGLATFATFAIIGVSDRGKSCRDGTCPRESFDRIRTDYIVADVALGVSVLALAGAAWVFLANRSSSTNAAWRTGPSGLEGRF